MFRALTNDLMIAAAILGSSLALSGCLTAPSATDDDAASADDEQTAEAEQAVESTNRLSMNRLSMNRLSMNGLSLAALSTDTKKITNNPLLETADGRDLLKYLVRCALPADKKLTGKYDGVTYTFQGAVGLAAQWLSGPLTQSGQRWVSACLLAHVNGYGIEVPISLRGGHPALATDPAERTAFSVQEAAFYGNVFQDNDEGDDDDDDDDDDESDDTSSLVLPTSGNFHVCAGATVQAQCGAGGGTYAPQRTCGTNAECLLQFTGPCRDATVSGNHACEKVVTSPTTYYKSCHSEARGTQGWSASSTKYPEVITVYLTSADYNALYTACPALP